MANSTSEYDWLVADSEGEEDTLITSDRAGPVNPEVSAIQTATFTTVDSPPRPHQTTTEISSASLFTPPPAEKSAVSTISPFTAESPVRPRPRPRPKPRTSIVNQSWLDGDKITGRNDTSIDRASTIASTSLIALSDKAREPISTSTAISSSTNDPYSSYGIAERAKMRVRNSRKSIQEGPSEVQSAKASYRVNSLEIIELTSDEDELSLIPTKPSKRQKSQSKPKAKKNTKMPPPSDNLFSDPPLADDPLPPSSIQAPSESIPSTIPTIPATTPPEVSPLRNPIPSPSPRKRKRRQHMIDSDIDADDIDMDPGVADAPLPSPSGPPLFFASSSVPIPEADVEVPYIATAETSLPKKGKKQPASKKKDTNKQAVSKSKKKGKQLVEVIIDTVDKSKLQSNASIDPSLPTSTTSAPPAPPQDESDLSPVPDSESEDVLQHQKVRGKEVPEPDVERPGATSGNKKKATITASMKRKGKSKAILSDDDEAGYTDKPATPPTGAEADVSVGVASKENIHPHLDEIPQRSKPSTKVSPLSGSDLTTRGRSTSIKPSVKSTPMSELIKRVNSQPGSPFAHSPRAAPIYSPYLKSSRSLLSRIAPLHPNRRTPPPPLPRPPPPKKSKKQLEMEERIEEELAETIEGWSCMADEERKQLKRARIDLELGGYD